MISNVRTLHFLYLEISFQLSFPLLLVHGRFFKEGREVEREALNPKFDFELSFTPEHTIPVNISPQYLYLARFSK